MLKLGRYLEACPAYKAAVARQQAKESGESVAATTITKAPATPLLTVPVSAKVIHIDPALMALSEEDKAERGRLNTWLLMAEYNGTRPSALVIMEVNARKHGVTVADIKGNKRVQSHVDARYDSIIDMHNKRRDFNLPRIAKELGKDHSTVFHAFKNRGVSYKPSVLDREQARRMFKSGMTTAEIGEALGYATLTISRAVQSIRGRKQLWEFTHAKIMTFAGRGLTYPEIAERTGFSKSTVRDHFRRARKMAQEVR